MDSSTLKRKKIRAMQIICILLLLIYVKNLIERQAFNDISNTFTEDYK